MQNPSRRHFLSGTVVTIAALSGCLGDENGNDPQDAEPKPATIEPDADGDVSDGLAAALEAVPAESAVEVEYRSIVLARPDDADSIEEFGPQIGAVTDSIEGVDPEDADRTLLIHSQDFENTFGVVSGSFDRPDPGTEIEAGDEWRIGEGDDLAFASADDLVAFAGGADDPPTDRVRTAADAARDDADSLVAADDRLPETFARLDDSAFVFYLPSVEGSTFPAVDQDRLASVAAGFESYPGRQSGTVENAYLLFPADGASIDDDELETILRELESGTVTETDVERGDAIYVETVSELPPDRDRDAAPDATIRASVDADEGRVEYEHVDGESVDAEELELWLDGERADGRPADEYDEFGVGDTLALETDPLASTALRWYDADEDVQYVYAQRAVGEEQFEADFDYDAGTVEITYRGARAADPEKLRLVHRSDEGAPTPEQFADAHDTLTAGDAVTVEDVAIEDAVTLRLDVPSGPTGGRPTLLYFRASPPRLHLRRLDDQLIANYFGDQPRPADEFRVLVDGETADTQLSDVTETLEPSDDVELGEVSTGSEVVVNWTEPDEPIEVARHLVAPDAHATLTYDAENGAVRAEHSGGEPVDAESLTLRVDGEPASVQPADEHDGFAPGDTVTLDADPLSVVELVWNEGEEAEDVLGQTVTGAESIEAAYHADERTVELVYVGERDADPDRLVVNRSDGAALGDGSRRFAEEYDTLTDGDSVSLEDVGTDERVRVTLPTDSGVYRPIFRFTVEPQGAFAFENRDGGIVATYHRAVEREADGFRVLADGEPADVQPADAYDALDRGDEIELGEFAVGTELVVEWVRPDDPVEVRTHVVAPDASFEADYDADAGTVSVEHAGGNEIDANRLSVYAGTSTDDPVDWGDGTVSDGDVTTVEVSGDVRTVRVVYRQQHLLETIRV